MGTGGFFLARYLGVFYRSRTGNIRFRVVWVKGGLEYGERGSEVRVGTRVCLGELVRRRDLG